LYLVIGIFGLICDVKDVFRVFGHNLLDPPQRGGASINVRLVELVDSRAKRLIDRRRGLAQDVGG
jgi:hypothetical protein